MFSPSLLSTLLLALAVSANPVVTIRDVPVTLPILRRLNTTSVGNLYLHDLNRAQALKAHGTDRVANKFISTPAVNELSSYIATVGVGSPPTQYDLIIDTGSSNTWVGANKAYVKTKSGTRTSNKVSVNYGSGSFSGIEYTDTVTLGSGLIIKKQSIGVASAADGLHELDGILGIGPVGLTVGSFSAAPNTKIPTVTDNLFSTHKIPSNSIGISFQPSTAENVANGEITWGGVDKSKLKGKITYVPITSTAPANKYWGITQAITYGKSKTVILSSTAGIVDTGSTLLLIASDAFARYQKATHATHDSSTGLLTLPSDGFSKLQSLYFKIGGTTFEFTANAQTWPRSLTTSIGGTTGKIYLVVGDLGTDSGKGLDFINGQAWLERFYSVYDTANKRVGIANTPFTMAKIN